MNWLKKLFCKQPNSQPIEVAHEFNQRMTEIKSAGVVDGSHYTDSVENVKQLKREGKNQEAIELLLKCVEATEAESIKAGESWGVAPWYYEQLAILYRKEKQFPKEVEILERYEKQEKAPGAGPSKLAERLLKAREMVKKHHA